MLALILGGIPFATVIFLPFIGIALQILRCESQVAQGGGCSLRQAVLAANKRPGPDRILLDRKNYRLTRTSASSIVDGIAGPLWVSDDLEIIGGGSPNTIIDRLGPSMWITM